MFLYSTHDDGVNDGSVRIIVPKDFADKRINIICLVLIAIFSDVFLTSVIKASTFSDESASNREIAQVPGVHGALSQRRN
jgi:hypothetical protein